MTPDYSLLGVATVLFVLGVLERVYDKRHRAEKDAWFHGKVKTVGVVSRIIERETYSSITERTSVSHSPVVLYRTPNGVAYEFEPETAVGEVGSKVPMAYDPKLPSDAREFPSEASHHYRGGCGFILVALAVGLAIKSFF